MNFCRKYFLPNLTPIGNNFTFFKVCTIANCETGCKKCTSEHQQPAVMSSKQYREF